MTLDIIKIPINASTNESIDLGLRDIETQVVDGCVMVSHITSMLPQPDGSTTIFISDGGDINTPLSFNEILQKIYN